MTTAEELYPALEDKHPSICTLDELEEKFWNEVAPDMRADSMDPGDYRPTYRWLSANGHRDLIYALSEYYGLSFGEFWTETLGFEEPTAGYNWEIDDEATLDAFQTYLERRSKKWSDATIRSHRGRLNRYAAAYYVVNGEEDLLSPVDPRRDVPEHEAKDACWEAFEHLDDEHARSTVEKIYRAVNQWYDHLDDRGLADTNPTTVVDSNFQWGDGRDDGPTEKLEPEQIRALYEAAKNNRERTLIVALCAWGLRTNEVASLHCDQLQFDGEAPFIEFGERKNGPSTVTVVYGMHDAQVRVSLLKDDDWNGYLFPSARSESGHVHRNTVRRWFQDLADRADVEVSGDVPKPKQARQYWYDAYSGIFEDVLEHVSEIAEEQGSSSAAVVWRNYLTEERRRELRREMMRDRLADAFEGTDE